MEVLNVDHIESEAEELEDKILQGAVFIYPTDTIYGVGCDATNAEAVKKIRDLKKRDKKPFSVIAPSKEWIIENCKVDENVKKWIEKLPGPYTLILELKNKNCVDKVVNNGLNTLGVRIPDHWLSNIFSNLEKPIVTTSVNITGEKNMVCLDCLNDEIKKNIDFCISDGKKEGPASTIINLVGNSEKIIAR